MTMLTADKDTLAVINTALAEADQLSAGYLSNLTSAVDLVSESGERRSRQAPFLELLLLGSTR